MILDCPNLVIPPFLGSGHLWRNNLFTERDIIIGHLLGPKFDDLTDSSLSILTQKWLQSQNLLAWKMPYDTNPVHDDIF